MKCKILTEDMWRRFLEDNMVEGESALINAHLEEDCADCEEFFAHMDAATERNLRHSYNSLIDAEKNENKKSPDMQRLVRNLSRETAGPIRTPERLTAWMRRSGAVWGFGRDTLAWTGGVFAVLVLAVGGLPNLYDANLPMQRDKGISPAIMSGSDINLDFLVGQRRPNGEMEVNRGMNGASYQPDELLMFRFNIARSGYVYLIQSRQDKYDVLYPSHIDKPAPLSAGQHQLSDDDGRLLAFPLEQAQGRRTIISIFSPVPLEIPDELLSVVVKATNSSGVVDKRQLESLGKGVSADAVYFDVGT